MDFATYKTYAFHKNGIDKVEISDLDKKRILRSIEDVMATKGFTKDSNPDLLISIFTKEKERVDVYNSFGFGWGWNPWWGMNYTNVSTTPEGVLFIDLIDSKTKELVWQGENENEKGICKSTGKVTVSKVVNSFTRFFKI